MTRKREHGFTLTETLVTVFIFSTAISLFGGAFAYVINVQKRAYNIQQVEENISAIFESMAKEIRVSEIALNSDSAACPASPSAALTMTHPVNGVITYSLSGTSLHRAVQGVADNVINSQTVEFTRLQFCITGTGYTDQKQPRVTIMASVRSKNTNQQATMNIQTTVSQRFLSD